MRRLSNLSTKHKILAINLSTCLIALLLTSGVFIGSAIITYQRAIVHELETTADIIGYNSRAAIVFNNRESAEAILTALAAAPNIVFAEIANEGGKTFAKYAGRNSKNNSSASRIHDDRDHAELIHLARKGIRGYTLEILGDYIDLYAPIFLDGDIIGTIWIRSDLQILYSTLASVIVIALISMLLSLALALVYGSRLQRIISGPISDLLRTMHVVSAKGDYSLRASKFGDDELGTLTDGFNKMLVQIQARDEDLESARGEVEAASRAKSEFLANMSHELRTPLNAILGFSEIIKNEINGPVGSVHYRDYAEDIHQSGQHLLDLINDILDLSKVESGTDELHEENIGIPEIIHSIMTLVKGRAQKGSVELEAELGDDLPMLRADERKLKQVLVNLLSNAIKFTPAGGKVTLEIWCHTDSGYVFQIVDTGIGIALEDIPKAMSPFGQVDSDLNRGYEGTGLGLPLTKSLVELHGGYLDLQSQVGIGTTVTVCFPAERIVRSPADIGALNTEEREASLKVGRLPASGTVAA